MLGLGGVIEAVSREDQFAQYAGVPARFSDWGRLRDPVSGGQPAAGRLERESGQRPQAAFHLRSDDVFRVCRVDSHTKSGFERLGNRLRDWGFLVFADNIFLHGACVCIPAAPRNSGRHRGPERPNRLPNDRARRLS